MTKPNDPRNVKEAFSLPWNWLAERERERVKEWRKKGRGGKEKEDDEEEEGKRREESADAAALG